MKTLNDLNENSTLQDFIEFYEGIDEDKWCIKNFIDDKGCCCAEGWLGNRRDCYTPLTCFTLRQLGATGITIVNDGEDKDYQQPTPKQRVLAYLKDLVANQAK